MLNVGSLLASVLQIFLLALLGRLIFDYVQMFSRTWRPKGIMLYFVEAIYTITDPPLADQAVVLPLQLMVDAMIQLNVVREF